MTKNRIQTGGMTLSELARFLRVSPHNAERWARDNGFRCVRKADRWRLRIAALPPGLTLPQVQERLGCSYVRAHQLAKTNGYAVAKTKRGARLRVTPDQWAGTDWTQRDVDIARRLNISRERVRQVRNLKGKPHEKETQTQAHDHNRASQSP